jgi:membrane-associated phospholipid phosphatase
MDWDWKLFGVYPPFWIHKFQNIPGLEPFLIWSYRNLNIIASAAFVLLLLNTKFLKRFILTIYVATMMSFPIWVSVPAISPIGMYVNNNLKASVPKDIATYIKSYPVTVRLAVDSTIIDATFTGLGRYPISTFPSMHAAWAFIIGCFVFKLRPPAIIVFLPFLIGTTLGAVYVAQHYSVDIMAGFLIAALAMLITGYIEKKYAEKECRDIGVGPNVVNLRKMVRKRA